MTWLELDIESVEMHVSQPARELPRHWFDPNAAGGSVPCAGPGCELCPPVGLAVEKVAVPAVVKNSPAVLRSVYVSRARWRSCWRG